MKPMRRMVALVLLCAFLAVSSRPARADSIQNKAIAVGVAIAVTAAAITAIIIILTTRKPTVTGCASANEGGLSLKEDSDGKSYVLRGDIADIRAGQRVRVSGKQKRHADPAEFDVAKVKKTMGACPAA